MPHDRDPDNDIVNGRLDALRADVDGHWTLDNERFDNVEKRAAIHTAAHDREHLAHERIHEVEAEGRRLATDALNERLHGLNEFRAQLSDQARTFVTRDLHDKLESDMNRRFDELRLAITNLEKGDVKQEGKGIGQAAVIAAIIGAVSLTSILIVVFLNLEKLLGGT